MNNQNKPGNYMKEIKQQLAGGQLPKPQPGAVSHMTVSHDDWCMIWNGGRCNCEPTVAKDAPKLNRAQRKK